LLRKLGKIIRIFQRTKTNPGFISSCYVFLGDKQSSHYKDSQKISATSLVPLKLAQISLVKLFVQSFKLDKEEILPRKLGNGPTKLQLIQERFLNSKLSSLPKKSLQMEVLFLKRASRLSPVKGTPISCIHNVRENRKNNKENKKPSLQKRRVRLHREKSRK